MKKILALTGFIFTGIFANAQNGLEGIVVEKYYVSDYNDSIVTDDNSSNPGSLPVGSVTWRIYVDMLQGYKFQAAYGIDNPVHEFRIETSTLFFNNEDRGATTPNAINNNYVDDNTVMLDSWLSVGAASSTQSGILKDQDDGINTVMNNDNALQNNDSSIGIPLTQEDGLMAVTPNPVTIVGITNEITVFDNQNDGTNGPVFSTINGSLACLGGSQGPDTVDNKVLIAQITTNGQLCFKLNVQIGTPSGGVENYVWQSPVGSEILEPTLEWCSVTGIKEESVASSFHVLSNPAKDIVTIEINATKPVKKSSYAIYDLNSRMLFTKALGQISETRTENIDISHLAQGAYFIELTLDGIASAKKIIKN
jgi:hypothetical protein